MLCSEHGFIVMIRKLILFAMILYYEHGFDTLNVDIISGQWIQHFACGYMLSYAMTKCCEQGFTIRTETSEEVVYRL